MKFKLLTSLALLLLLFSVAINVLLGLFAIKTIDDKSRIEKEFADYKKFKEFSVENIIKNPLISELDNIRQVQKKPKPVEDLYVTGWLPDWDIPNSFTSVKENVSSFDGISPVWFWVNEDGSLKETPYMNDPEFINYAKQNNLELIPTITLFDAEILSKILNNEENFSRHIDAIMNQVIDNNYDGIDLDYESTYLKDKEKFFDLLEQLALKLAEADKTFVFTVLPKWGTEVYYNGLPQTRMVQDYKRIADLVDEFRIMTYEYTGRKNRYYGPVAPVAWMEDTIRYAIFSGVPREKILLGIHTYSYNYTEREKLPNLNYYPSFEPQNDDSKEDALAHFPSDVEEVLAANKVEVTFEEEWGEAIGTYTSASGIKRYIVFPTQESINMRKQLAADYGLKGVTYWRVGSEGELKY